jgi:hypothetical protein
MNQFVANILDFLLSIPLLLLGGAFAFAVLRTGWASIVLLPISIIKDIHRKEHVSKGQYVLLAFFIWFWIGLIGGLIQICLGD